MKKKELKVGEKYLSKHGWPVELKAVGEGENEGKAKVFLLPENTELVLPITDMQPYVEANIHKDARAAMRHQERKAKTDEQEEPQPSNGKEKPAKKGKASKSKAKKPKNKKARRFFLPVWLFLDPTRAYGRFAERIGIMRSMSGWSLNTLAGTALHALFKEHTAVQIHELIGTCKIAKMRSPNDKNYLDSRKPKVKK